MMLYLEFLTEFGDHRVVEISTIVNDDSLWHTVTTDQVMLDKLRHNILGNSNKRSSLNPLREVINSHQDEAMPIGSGRSNLSDHVNTHIAKGQGAVKTFKGTRGTCTLSAQIWHL